MGEEQAGYPEKEGQADGKAHTVSCPAHESRAVMLGRHGGKRGGKGRGGQHTENNELFYHAHRCRRDEAQAVNHGSENQKGYVDKAFL